MSDIARSSADVWSALRKQTPARIGLGAAGTSVATRDHLAFQLAHARARDAVHDRMNADDIVAQIATRGLQATALQTAAPDRETFLGRPDLGRRLSEDSRASLRAQAGVCDLAFAIGDGLSARAIARNALPFLDCALQLLAPSGWKIGPVSVVEQARVAVGDEIGEILGAGMVAVLIGERPGLTSPDSLGVYLTFAPKIGRADAERNCISNVRPEGMPCQEAAQRFAYLCAEARRLGFSGVNLKDRSMISREPVGELPGRNQSE